MTIEEAIKILDPETTREALSTCSTKGEAIRVVEEACKVACAALRAQLEAEKDGRLVVLPCKEGDKLVRGSRAFKADHWNVILTAFAESPRESEKLGLFSIKEAEAALGGPHE